MKTAVITGATSGIGYAAAEALARKGFFVIGTGKNGTRCRDAEKQLENVPGDRVLFIPADLSSLRQVNRLSESVGEELGAAGFSGIDVLVNNAGIFTSWYMATEDGFESQFAVNYLSHFLLTQKLLPLLRQPGNSRIIMVSSGSHYNTRLRWKDIQLRRRYSPLAAYKQTKLAAVMFAYELNRRLPANSGIRAYAADPGLVNTAIGIKQTGGVEKFVWSRRRKYGTTPEKGAGTAVFLAASDPLPSFREVYWKDCRPKPASPYARKPAEASRLWELSERMCGIGSKDHSFCRR